MTENLDKRYLELVKKSLRFNLWSTRPDLLDLCIHEYRGLRRIVLLTLSKLLKCKNFGLVRILHYTDEQIEQGQTGPSFGFTLLGTKRLDNLQYCVETAIKDGIAGDLIETGVWRGGASILMRAVLEAYPHEERKVYLADSFEGLPAPDVANYPVDRGDLHHKYNYLAVSQQEVENNFESYGLLDEKVVFLKGWFKDTMPAAPMDKLAVMHLDGDMYESTMEVLVNLYPKLSPGGFCIIDDYALPRCRKAVNDYRKEHQINDEVIKVDFTGIYWRKSG